MEPRIPNFRRPGRAGGYYPDRGQTALFGGVCPPMLVIPAFLALIVYCGEVKAQLPGPREERSTETAVKGLPDVRDNAKVFDEEAVAAAHKELRRIEHETSVAIVIETIETLKGEALDKAAERLASQTGIHGVFILIAKKEHEIDVLASRKYQSGLTRAYRDMIKEHFTTDFRNREFNAGLKHGVEFTGSLIARLIKDDKLPKPISAASAFGLTPSISPPAPFTSALVVRDRVRLTLAGARTILAGAEAKAASMQLKINIAVVDDGGHLLAFERVDGARPASAYTAITKATSAATFRQPTGPQPPAAANPDLLLSLSLQNAAQASGGKITTLYGGVPVIVDDQVIGGVGIGGGTGEQDAQIARAGIQSLLDQLAEEHHASKANDATEKGK